MSLHANEKRQAKLTLIGTRDLDAHVRADDFVLKTLKAVLPRHGLVYDEDSEKIWWR
jgi:hypothetical protein